MILKNNQNAPDFITTDVCGNALQLSRFKGQKILLTFYRHVGCPVHHLRFSELSQYDEVFRNAGLVVLAIFESSGENLRKYCEEGGYHAKLIPNPDFDLYEKYDIETNRLKLLYSMYKGVFAKRMEGEKRMKQKFQPEGHLDLMGGDFLIDEEGILKRVYYNQFLGDHLPVNEILDFINDPSYSPAIEPVPFCGV